MEHLSNDHEEHPNQHKNSNKLYTEMVHPILNLTESQWKLRQQHDQIFPMEGSHCRTNTSIKNRNKSKKA